MLPVVEQQHDKHQVVCQASVPLLNLLPITPSVVPQVLPSPSGVVSPAGLSPGAIAGIVIGAAAFAAIVAGLIVFLVDRRRKQRDEDDKIAALSDTSSRRHRVRDRGVV